MEVLPQSPWGTEGAVSTAPTPPSFWQRHKIPLIAGILLLVLALIGSFYYFFVYRAPQQLPISLEIEASQALRGAATPVIVKVINPSVAAIQDIELEIRLPIGVSVSGEIIGAESDSSSSVIRYKIAEIAPSGTEMKSFEVIADLSDQTVVPITGSGSYTTEQARGKRFTFEGRRDLVVSQSAVFVGVEAPAAVPVGDPFTVTLRYRNNQDVALVNPEIELVLPRGTSLRSSDPKVTTGSTWKLETLEPGDAGTITASLVASRDASNPLTLRGILKSDNRVFAEQIAGVQVARDALSLSVEAAGSVTPIFKPDQLVTYNATIKNVSSVPLKDLVVTAELKSSFFDLSTVRATDGSLAASKPLVTWSGIGDEKLRVVQSGGEVRVSFSVRIKENGFGTDPELPVLFTVTSPTVPPGVAASAVRAGTTITAKLATALVASSKIYYEDPRGALSNSGPHPPKVGEETTYIITWSVEAGTSALKNVEMVATVQPGVTVTDTLISSNEKKPTYNSANGQLRWVIETIPAGRAESTSVKVSITPAANQVGREVPLLGGTTVKAKDGFTGVEFEERFPSLSSNVDDAGDTSSGVVKE